MTSCAILLGLILLPATIAGRAGVHGLQRVALSLDTLPADTVVVRPLGRRPTAIRVLVRQGTVRRKSDSVGETTLQTDAPAVLIVSPEAMWLRIMTVSDWQAVEVNIAGMVRRRHERAPWGRVVTFRKIGARWQTETNFLRADSVAVGTGQGGVAITYLANEGVMLSSGTKRVLIDGLFQKYETGYALPADSTRARLERAHAPFDAVDLILVTHRHGDHFHPASVAAHMRANPRATLLTSAQVIDSLRSRLGPAAVSGPRFMARTTAPGTRRREVVNGIAVELLGLPHGGRRHRAVEHLGYIVELGGRRILHVGDTDVSESAFAAFRLDTARIDVALLPNWMVTSREGARVIRRWIRPRQVVAFHVGEGEERNVARAVRAMFPAAITLVRSLETHRW